MPRKARIDAPGALHHIICRGIAKSKIFLDAKDRYSFLKRLEKILTDTNTPCYAWALMPNHFHLLLRTGIVPISTIMRRLLTGYAIYHNRRHKRQGHLFQNRYKSILCQENKYLLELVRYIHLNPLRGKIVKDIEHLDKYPYCGHSAILGNKSNSWQEIDKILALFHDKRHLALRSYRNFVKKGVAQGRRPELVGGGLIRSVGGWSAFISMRQAKNYQKGDERILGDGDFVEQTLKAADEAMERKSALQAQGFDLDKTAKRVADLLEMDTAEVWASGRYHHIVRARSLLCYWAVRELGTSMALLSKMLNISIPAVSKSVVRGEKIAKDMNYRLSDG
ncbi:MAG: transposase [Desulfobacterales bacterium]|jgi:REP element-mobilizing transposase RayT